MSHGRAIVAGIGIGIFIVAVLQKLGLAAEPRQVVAARVNGEVISLAEVDAALKQRLMPLSAETAAQMRQLRAEVLTGLIDDLLVRQFLREHGPKIDPAEINQQLAALQTALKAQDKSFAAYLREQDQTEVQLRANMTLLLQLDRYVKQNTTEADLKHFYEANKDYFDNVTVRTSHIVIRLPADAAPAERDKARQRLRALRADIAAGKIDFASAAKANSQSPSAPKGGDIGFIERKFQIIDEAYAKTAFAMKVGEISDVVQTEIGLHLIKVTERKAGKPLKYEQVAENVRDAYAEELRIALLNQLRKKAKIEVTLP
jgi:peptidyl-prolyl cis-trans isomerase C